MNFLIKFFDGNVPQNFQAKLVSLPSCKVQDLQLSDKFWGKLTSKVYFRGVFNGNFWELNCNRFLANESTCDRVSYELPLQNQPKKYTRLDSHDTMCRRHFTDFTQILLQSYMIIRVRDHKACYPDGKFEYIWKRLWRAWRTSDQEWKEIIERKKQCKSQKACNRGVASWFNNQTKLTWLGPPLMS